MFNNLVQTLYRARSIITNSVMYSFIHLRLVRARDVNVLFFLDFSFRYDSVHQKYKRLKRYVAHFMA